MVMIKTEWLNNKKIIHKNITKPCHSCGFCPYGQLVEEFKIRKVRSKKYSCKVFGHDCPAFYHSEMIREDY